jgi:hypothetical protein
LTGVGKARNVTGTGFGSTIGTGFGSEKVSGSDIGGGGGGESSSPPNPPPSSA